MQISQSRVKVIVKELTKGVELYKGLVEKNKQSLSQYGIVEFDGCIEHYEGNLYRCEVQLNHFKTLIK